SELPPGGRLVSREGDLWRWDGFVARAEAPKPAAVRLEQKTRLAEVEAEIEKLEPKVKAARDVLTAAQGSLRQAEETLKAARCEPPGLESRTAQARANLERLDRESARREAQAASLDDLIVRFQGELAEHEAQLAAVLAASEGQGESGDLADRLA